MDSGTEQIYRVGTFPAKVKEKFIFYKASSPLSPSSLLKLPNWCGVVEEPISFQYSLIDMMVCHFEPQIQNSDTLGSSDVKICVSYM